MYNRSYRYKDPVFSSYGKTNPMKNPPVKDTQPPAPDMATSEAHTSVIPFSFNKLKNLSADDYMLIFLIFILIKDNDKPDWALILSLGYILFDIKDN